MKSKNRKQNQVPADFREGIVIFDEDEFYGVYLEILLTSLKELPVVKITGKRDFNEFKQKFTKGDYSKNIYIVDELFGWGEVDIRQLVQNLRIKDSQAVVIGATALEDGEISNLKIYDHIAVKSKGNHAQSLNKILADVMGVELQVDNSDPELQKF